VHNLWLPNTSRLDKVVKVDLCTLGDIGTKVSHRTEHSANLKDGFVVAW